MKFISMRVNHIIPIFSPQYNNTIFVKMYILICPHTCKSTPTNNCLRLLSSYTPAHYPSSLVRPRSKHTERYGKISRSGGGTPPARSALLASARSTHTNAAHGIVKVLARSFSPRLSGCLACRSHSGLFLTQQQPRPILFSPLRTYGLVHVSSRAIARTSAVLDQAAGQRSAVAGKSNKQLAI